MKKGCLYMAAAMLVFALIALFFDTTGTWVGLGTAGFSLLLGWDQKRSDARNTAFRARHGLPVQERTGWF